MSMVVIVFFTACNESDDFEFENTESFKNNEEKMHTLGFNAVFTGTYQFQGVDDAICGPWPMIRVINTGEGNGTHFKKLTSYFDFCVNADDATYPHGYMDAYFEDENGDKLFVSIESGQVLPGRVPGMPNYALSYFKDHFEITGGTGHFEGATGSGYTNDYNFIGKDDVNYTSHHWQGVITLNK